jgi:hypothetical protein
VFEPLPYPKGRVVDCSDEIIDAARRFFEDLLNIEYGEQLFNDPTFENELRRILEGASRSLVANLSNKHGDMALDDALVRSIGLNLFRAFSENLAPSLRGLFDAIDGTNTQ